MTLQDLLDKILRRQPASATTARERLQLVLVGDQDCDDEGSSARWIFDDGPPSTTASSDLDGDGKCE